MSTKWKRRLYQLSSFLFGIVFGLWKPQLTQNMLPLLGIIVGIGYFFLSRITSERGKELDDIHWFLLIQMLMYFLIGGALSSTILLTFHMIQNQSK